MKRIAYFVSPHGFGHAARAAAVMQAIPAGSAAVQFEIFTTIPRWFFQDSMTVPFGYHEILTDIGLVQKTAFQADLPQTLSKLNALLPFNKSFITKVANHIKKLKTCLIVSDIAPMGILVAKEAGIPSVLVENFTWDWIYNHYVAADDRFKSYITYLRDLFNMADYHIQTEPVCSPGEADLKTMPVSRSVNIPADRIRHRLKLADTVKMVLITTGGINHSYNFLNNLRELPEIRFVLPGAGSRTECRQNLIILPHRSDYFHPDLVNASDAVIGKAGYSTLSEIYHAGVPFGYVLRSNFRESKPLAAFIAGNMQGIALTESEFSDGKWITQIADLLRMKRLKRPVENGADQIANFIRKKLL